jgi:drug/metabolite transporter (DMT)-like permease
MSGTTPADTQPARSSNWVVLYLILGLIWGSSFLFTHVALQAIPPFGVVFWRLLLGALALATVIAVKRIALPRDWKPWLLMAGGGAFMNALPFSLFAFAQQHVTSILASIINGSTPIMTLLALLTIFRGEKLKLHLIVGLLVGMAGIFVVLAVWQGFGDNDPLAVVALILAVACYGIGGPFIVRFVTPLKLPNEVMSFAQVGSASLIVLPFYLANPTATGPMTATILGATVLLGAVGSGVAYILYYAIIKQVGSALANSVTYLTPLVATVLGVTLLGEPLQWYQPVGALVVILGALISQGRLRFTRSAKPDA